MFRRNRFRKNIVESSERLLSGIYDDIDKHKSIIKRIQDFPEMENVHKELSAVLSDLRNAEADLRQVIRKMKYKHV